MTTEETSIKPKMSHSDQSSRSQNGNSLQNIQTIITRLNNEKKLNNEQRDILLNMIRREDEAILEVLGQNLSQEEIELAIFKLVGISTPIKRQKRHSDEMKIDDDSHISEIHTLIQKLCTDANTNTKISIAKMSVKNMKKIINTLISHPEKQKNRILRKKNFSVKKFIFDIEAAHLIIKSIGFIENDNEALIINESSCDRVKLQNALNELDGALEHLVPLKSSGPRLKCVGGCGFFGDADLDGLCSVCHKNRIHGRQTKPGKIEKPRQKCNQNCGFFGSEHLNGMCSQCYKAKNGNIPKIRENQRQKPKTPKERWKIALLKVRAVLYFRKTIQTQQSDKTRCWKCHRKVGIIGIRCRCGYYFCGRHRSTLDHECVYDYRKSFAKKFLKENPLIQADKLDKM